MGQRRKLSFLSVVGTPRGAVRAPTSDVGTQSHLQPLGVGSAPLVHARAERGHRSATSLPLAGGVLAILICAGALLAGCVSSSKAHARAQQAYMAGQNAAFQQQLQMQSVQTNGVTVLGPVQNPHVPWVAGLTLAQAIATANYLDPNMPKEIVITRQGESAKLAPNWLLTGADIPLEPGDVIEIKP